MRDFRPVFQITGILLVALSGVMVIPSVLALFSDRQLAEIFGISALMTFFVGGGLALSARGKIAYLTLRSAFLLTVFSWTALTAAAALPLWFAPLGLDFTDAFFEAMSGITTTGATVMTNLDATAQPILLWRSLLQWIGGIGIVVTGIAILPILQIGGMQLFRLESSDTSDKILPRATSIATLISLIYLGLTILCALAYSMVGMPAFDAIAHAMTTIATGGFSTRDASMGAFAPLGADMVACVFMLAGATPFIVYMQLLRGSPSKAFSEPQIGAFFSTVAVSILVLALFLALSDYYSDQDALRHATFAVITVITGTGYATSDYSLWGPTTQVFFFMLMFIGGCAGSTSCGIKIFRFQVALSALLAYLNEMLRPHAIIPRRYGKRTLGDAAVYSVLSFFFLYLVSFTILAILLSLLGIAPVTAISAAATAISNVGPGLGSEIGPAGNFASLPDLAKWLLSLAMLIGRLEVFPVLVLFTAGFWRD
jgi:trk system potassium uptake protein